MTSMSGEFVSNVGNSGNGFRISFSEEKPEQRVSKLTVSSDFTHSYEETYNDEDDVLIVDIDYGDVNTNETYDGTEADPQESISRSNSLSKTATNQKPRFGLRRFKSVEETINVSPKVNSGKKKLGKTSSDYESRYKGLERNEARLTLSADFTHSYEENFEGDDELLIVDIDYTKGTSNVEENFEDSVFGSSDRLAGSKNRNKANLRKYRSDEDVRRSSYKHSDWQRSISGYEITFTNESAPNEKKKLSLSADFSASGEEIFSPIDAKKYEESVENKIREEESEKVNEEFFDIKDDFVTSTPQKNVHDVVLNNGDKVHRQDAKKALFASENLAKTIINTNGYASKEVKTILSLASQKGDAAPNASAEYIGDNFQYDENEEGKVEVFDTWDASAEMKAVAVDADISKKTGIEQLDNVENLTGKYQDSDASEMEDSAKEMTDDKGIDLDDIFIIDGDRIEKEAISLDILEDTDERSQFNKSQRANAYLYLENIKSDGPDLAITDDCVEVKMDYDKNDNSSEKSDAMIPASRKGTTEEKVHVSIKEDIDEFFEDHDDSQKPGKVDFNLDKGIIEEKRHDANDKLLQGEQEVKRELFDEQGDRTTDITVVPERIFYKMVIVKETESLLDTAKEPKGLISAASRGIWRLFFGKNEQKDDVNKNYNFENAGIESTKSEYLFSLPEVTNVEGSESLEVEEPANSVNLLEDNIQEDVCAENKKKGKKTKFFSFLGIGRESKKEEVEKKIDDDQFIIPNGSCRYDNDDKYIDTSEKRTVAENNVMQLQNIPHLVNKVYRLKDFHSDDKILTETIRIFLQQESIPFI